MSTQIIASDLLVNLSTEEQQIIAGGQGGYGGEEYRGRRRNKYKCDYCYDCRRYDD